MKHGHPLAGTECTKDLQELYHLVTGLVSGFQFLHYILNHPLHQCRLVEHITRRRRWGEGWGREGEEEGERRGAVNTMQSTITSMPTAGPEDLEL